MNTTHEVTFPEHGDLYLEERPGDDPAIVYTQTGRTREDQRDPRLQRRCTRCPWQEDMDI